MRDVSNEGKAPDTFCGPWQVLTQKKNQWVVCCNFSCNIRVVNIRKHWVGACGPKGPDGVAPSGGGRFSKNMRRAMKR